jgi:hypothetical protein
MHPNRSVFSPRASRAFISEAKHRPTPHRIPVCGSTPRHHSSRPLRPSARSRVPPSACSGDLFGHPVSSIPPFRKGGHRDKPMANEVLCFCTRPSIDFCVLRRHEYLDGGLSPLRMTACTAHTPGMSGTLLCVGFMPWFGSGGGLRVLCRHCPSPLADPAELRTSTPR